MKFARDIALPTAFFSHWAIACADPEWDRMTPTPPEKSQKYRVFLAILVQILWKITKIVSMIRKYHNHKPQTTPWHREEEPLNHHETPGRQIKQSNQLSLPHKATEPAFNVGHYRPASVTLNGVSLAGRRCSAFSAFWILSLSLFIKKQQ